jgi:hypothetical protein
MVKDRKPGLLRVFSPAGDNRRVSHKSRLFRAAALLSLMVPAISSARYVRDTLGPWTYSGSGTATGASVVVDREGFVHMAGNRTGVTRDVVYLIYDNLDFGSLIGGSILNPAGTNDGVPSLYMDWHFPLPPAEVHSDIWIGFTVTRAGQGGNMYVRKFASSGDANTATEYNSPNFESVAGLTVFSGPVPDMMDPEAVGTVNIAGQDMLVLWRNTKQAGGSYIFNSTTIWDPGGGDIYGKACVRGELDTTWAVGQSASGIWLGKYSSSNWTGAGGEGHPLSLAGFPVLFPAAGAEVRAATRDALNNLWVAGKLGADAAVWKFSPLGALATGFPVIWAGTGPSVFNGIALDEESTAYAVGEYGEDMPLVGISQGGTVVSSTLFDITDIIAGNGIAIGRDRAIWIAATITAGAASTIWVGTESALVRYAYSIDPSPAEVEDFVLRAPRGGLLNLAKGETMSILINPPRAGDIKVVILTMRGEVVRDFVIQSGGGRTVSASWDGRNSSGEMVAAGVYAIRVSGGGVKGLKRAAVIRSNK